MISFQKEINGTLYTFETGRNYSVAEAIKGNHVGYSLGHSTDGYISEIILKNNSEADKEPKKIGSLIYDPVGDIITYFKHVKQEKHEFHTSESFGINNLVLSNLCPKDKIVIFEHLGSRKNIYSISVRKALLYATYMTFKNYEKQAFIPKAEFKLKEEKEKPKRKKYVKRSK